jgi:hypothetical protein
VVKRDSKGKPRKRASSAKAKDAETRLFSKLQTESLKVHGDPLDTPKKAGAKKKGK